MYAFIVKNDEGTWDIWRTLADIPIPAKKARVDAALASGNPIIGRDVTEHKAVVRSGSVWNGTEFTGGDPSSIKAENSDIHLYAYLCDNVVILMHVEQPNATTIPLLDAVFESDNTMIRLPEGQTAKVGDIWDGENVLSR